MSELSENKVDGSKWNIDEMLRISVLLKGIETH